MAGPAAPQLHPRQAVERAQALRRVDQATRDVGDKATAGAAMAAYWALGALLLAAMTAVIGARMGIRAW